MRPKITCHMVTSLDGRLHPDRWTDPVGGRIGDLIDKHYDATAECLEAGGWIAGRKTMAAYAEREEMPDLLAEPQARPFHAPDRAGRNLAVAIDPSGRLRYAGSDIGGDRAVAVLSERVSDDYLAGLRDKAVSYVFAGPDGRRLGVALETLGDVFGVGHLLLEGGAVTNGAFLAAGLIDEVSTLICPASDGLAGIPSIFEHSAPPGSHPAAGQHLRLRSCEVLEGGVIWLRHDVVRG